MKTAPMKRRKRLSGIGVLASGLSGCLGTLSGENNSVEYEQCGLSYIDIADLPGPARKEVTTAIGEGVYQTDGELVLPEVMDIERSYLTFSAVGAVIVPLFVPAGAETGLEADTPYIHGRCGATIGAFTGKKRGTQRRVGRLILYKEPVTSSFPPTAWK